MHTKYQKPATHDNEGEAKATTKLSMIVTGPVLRELTKRDAKWNTQ